MHGFDVPRLIVAVLAFLVIVVVLTLVLVDRSREITRCRWCGRLCVVLYAVSQFAGAVNRFGQPYTWTVGLAVASNATALVAFGWSLLTCPGEHADRDTPGKQTPADRWG